MAPASAVSYSPSSRSSSRVSSWSMIPVMSLATSCSVLVVGSDCLSMASTRSGALGSPGGTGEWGEGELATGSKVKRRRSRRFSALFNCFIVSTEDRK